MYLSSQDPAYEGLSMHGRFGRISYFAWHMLLALGLLMLLGTAWLIAPHLFDQAIFIIDASSMIALLLLLIAQIGAVYFHIVFTVRRLHDCELNPYWAILCMIPFANWLWAFYLLFKPGINQKNVYGDVRHTLIWEKYLTYLSTLILVLFIIIFILFTK